MAHIWKRIEDSWQAHPLEAKGVDLAGNDVRIIRTGSARAFDARRPAWALIGSVKAGVAVNGCLTAGIRLLADRDEIRVPARGTAETFFFSTERIAVIEPFPGSERGLFCPRCRQEIPAGTDAVQCPQCGVWHHQTGSLPCWTYTEDHCALCPQPAGLSGAYRWSPEEL